MDVTKGHPGKTSAIWPAGNESRLEAGHRNPIIAIARLEPCHRDRADEALVGTKLQQVRLWYAAACTRQGANQLDLGHTPARIGQANHFQPEPGCRRHHRIKRLQGDSGDRGHHALFVAQPQIGPGARVAGGADRSRRQPV